jgi:MFS family permease
MIKAAPISAYQFLMIAICCLAYAADGVDFAVLPLAAPALAKAWGIKPALMGVALSAHGVGLVVGSFFIAPIADRIGRRGVTQAAVAVLALTMFLSATTGTLTTLILLRFVTGVALGTLVVTLNVMVSELANEKSRTLSVGILHTGYTLGTMAGGLIAAILLESHGWRALFYAAGAISTGTFIATLFLAETPSFLVLARPAGALEKLNRLLRRMNLPPVDALPPVPPKTEQKVGVGALLVRGARKRTMLICLAGFFFTVAGTFMASWRPQILASAGISLYWVGISAVIAGGAGIVSHVGVGALARKTGEVPLAVVTLLGMGFFFLLFGLVPRGNVGGFMAVTGLTTFFNTGAYTAVFLVGIATFPALTRNAGIGLLNGCARLGTIVGPSLGGILLQADLGRLGTLALFASLLLIPAFAVWSLGRNGPIRPA